MALQLPAWTVQLVGAVCNAVVRFPAMAMVQAAVHPTPAVGGQRNHAHCVLYAADVAGVHHHQPAMELLQHM